MEPKQIQRDELIEMVEKIQSFAGSEEEIDILIDMFLQNVPDPGALDYLHAKKYESLTPDQIVDKALSYKPFYL